MFKGDPGRVLYGGTCGFNSAAFDLIIGADGGSLVPGINYLTPPDSVYDGLEGTIFSIVPRADGVGVDYFLEPNPRNPITSTFGFFFATLP
jgi:hypothetical protein